MNDIPSMADRWRNPCRRPVGAPGDHWDEWYAHTSNTTDRILFGARHACARLRKERDEARDALEGNPSTLAHIVNEICGEQDRSDHSVVSLAALILVSFDQMQKRIDELTKELAETTAKNAGDSFELQSLRSQIPEIQRQRDDAMTELVDVMAERDAAREKLHLRVSQLTEDHRTELARLRKELADVTTSKWTPGTHSLNDRGYIADACNCCSETVDEPHTWETCANGLVIERDRLVDLLSELGGEQMKALDIASQYGGIDGEHHKTWVIDQMVRALTGDGYAEWVRDACDGEDGPDTYSWDEGVAP